MLDVAALLGEIAPDKPCGDNLEYDPTFLAMEQAAQGKPEQQFGGTVVPAEDPNWREVQSHALDLLTRTKDLRVVVQLARAVLNTSGLTAFCQTLALIRGLVERYWESFHPQLDPEDGNDPTLRVNLLVSLCDSATTLTYLRKTPLVSSRTVGRFSWRDWAIGKGDLPAPAGAEPPSVATIEAAFMDCDLNELQATAQAARDAIEHVTAIEAGMTAQVGAGRAASLAELNGALKGIVAVLAEQLARRGVVEPSAEGAAAAENGQQQSLNGEIRTREDVIRMLDKLCDYYDRYEPSSPLPILLKRAKRLTTKGFLDIIRDLVPDGVAQAEMLRGVDEQPS